MSVAVLVLLIVIGVWLAGAVAVIAIWGDTNADFPPMGEGRDTPRTGTIAIIWPFALLCAVLGVIVFGIARLGMRLHRRRKRRKGDDEIPRARWRP